MYLWISHDNPTCYFATNTHLLQFGKCIWTSHDTFTCYFATNKHLLPFVMYLWTSHDIPSCYLLSHCQLEQPVYLRTPSVAHWCLNGYEHWYCDYSATVVTLSVLELVWLAGMFRFVVVYCVKNMNWIELTGISIPFFSEGWKILLP